MTDCPVPGRTPRGGENEAGIPTCKSRLALARESREGRITAEAGSGLVNEQGVVTGIPFDAGLPDGFSANRRVAGGKPPIRR